MSGYGFTSSVATPSGLNFKGSWNANTNVPFLQSGVGTGGDYYIVSTAGTTNLDGITDWQVGDWAIFESATNMWQKIDNHDIQAYTTVQDEGISLPQQSVLDFRGIGVQVTNEPAKTVVTVLEGLPATSYGLYAQTANSIPVAATITEGSIIGPGVGTLSVPANGFFVGASFRADFGGVMSAKTNDKIRIRIKSGLVTLADSGDLTMPSITNQVWSLTINFTIRNTGIPGVASIVTLANLLVLKLAGANQEGFGWNFVNSTTFNTTIPNTLDVTAQWNSNSVLNSIYSDIFVLNKIY